MLLFDGKQVVRVETKYKQKDLFNVGKEMSDRKGTGNYDKDRTQFNVEYVSMNERNLYQEVKKTLNKRNIEYLNKPNTNLLNGITFTSGNEFFESLGMKFVDSGRVYHTGDKKGQKVKVPYIKAKGDIPQAISYYFDSCMDYLKEFVGEENIILAQIHYDEDTPHLQAYFLPVVNEVKRKCYVKDKDGNVVKEEVKNKSGNVTLVPKLKRDNNGKIVYETIKGKFLNNDQFWKDKGGANSFAKMQDSFNKFITERGFKLDRGNVGANIDRKTKLEYQIEENKAELEEIRKEKDYTLEIIENSKNTLESASKSVNKDVLNPKKSIVGYNSNDVDKLINYSKNLEQINIIKNNEIKTKDITIEKLVEENESFKDNKEILKRNDIIKKQKTTIKEQKNEINRLNSLVDILNHNIESLKTKLEKEVDKWKRILKKVCKAIDKVLDRKPKYELEDYERLADAINLDYYDYKNNKEKKKEKDFEIGL